MNRKFLYWLFGVAAVLRLGFVGLAPAWYDENFTLILTRLPLSRMLAAAAGDVHPPLWYLLLWPLGQLHAPIWVLRIPAAVFAIGSVWLFWRILEKLELPPRVRAAALILMAVMPIQLYYAQEARMYTLLEFLILAAFLAMQQRKYVWFGLACALMLWTQYYGFFYLAALALVALIWFPEKRIYYYGSEDWEINHSRGKILLTVTLAGLSFLPWALVMRSQMTTLEGGYWMQLTGPGMLLRMLFENLFMPPANAVAQIPLMLGCFAWLAMALIYAIRKPLKRIGIIYLMAFLPFALALLVSLVWQPILHYRPLIGISPFLYILLAAPVQALFDGKRFKLAQALYAMIFIFPLIFVCDGQILLYMRMNKTPSADAEMAYIQAHWQPGDIIYHFTDDSWVNLTPYNSLPNYKAPDCGLTLGALSQPTRLAMGQQIIPLADLAYKRAWLLWSDSPLAPQPCTNAQLTALGLDPKKPLLIACSDEYYFDGLWLAERR